MRHKEISGKMWGSLTGQSGCGKLGFAGVRRNRTVAGRKAPRGRPALTIGPSPTAPPGERPARSGLAPVCLARPPFASFTHRLYGYAFGVNEAVIYYVGCYIQGTLLSGGSMGKGTPGAGGGWGCALGVHQAHHMKYKLIIRHKGRVIFDQVSYDDLKGAIEAAAFICDQHEKLNDVHQFSIDVNPDTVEKAGVTRLMMPGRP